MRNYKLIVLLSILPLIPACDSDSGCQPPPCPPPDNIGYELLFELVDENGEGLDFTDFDDSDFSLVESVFPVPRILSSGSQILMLLAQETVGSNAFNFAIDTPFGVSDRISLTTEDSTQNQDCSCPNYIIMSITIDGMEVNLEERVIQLRIRD